VVEDSIVRSTIRWWQRSDGRWEATLPDGSCLTTLTRQGLLCLVARRCSDLGIAYRFEPCP
jgi:hypothetical protein